MLHLSYALDVPKNIVLCVDDEPIVLRACSTALAMAGFRPVVAENGAAGLEVFSNLRAEICLTLADVIMPGLNGIALAECILEMEPHAKILLMSGYGDTVIGSQGANALPVIRKPFIHSLLIGRIRSILEAAGEAASAD